MDNPILAKEICKITIFFPVDSDDKAIERKKKIAEVMSDIPTARIQFTIASGGPPMGG